MSPIVKMLQNRVVRHLLCELDFHFLVIVLLLSVFSVGFLGDVRSPGEELRRVLVYSPILNILIIVLSFLALAPWSFAWSAAKRCLIWATVNFLGGMALTLILLSSRVLFAGAAEIWSQLCSDHLEPIEAWNDHLREAGPGSDSHLTEREICCSLSLTGLHADRIGNKDVRHRGVHDAVAAFHCGTSQRWL